MYRFVLVDMRLKLPTCKANERPSIDKITVQTGSQKSYRLSHMKISNCMCMQSHDIESDIKEDKFYGSNKKKKLEEKRDHSGGHRYGVTMLAYKMFKFPISRERKKCRFTLRTQPTAYLSNAAINLIAIPRAPLNV